MKKIFLLTILFLIAIASIGGAMNKKYWFLDEDDDNIDFFIDYLMPTQRLFNGDPYGRLGQELASARWSKAGMKNPNPLPEAAATSPGGYVIPGVNGGTVMNGFFPPRKYIAIYVDGSDFSDDRFIWSTLNRKQFVKIPAFGTISENGYGKKSALYKNFLAYLDQIDVNTVVCLVSKDFGKTWSSPVPIVAVSSDNLICQDIQIDNDGWIWIGTLDSTGQMSIYLSKDGGKTFSRPGFINNGQANRFLADFTIAVTNVGTDKIIYASNVTADYTGIDVWKITNNGATFTKIFTQTEPYRGVQDFPIITADGNDWALMYEYINTNGNTSAKIITNGSVSYTAPLTEAWMAAIPNQMIRNHGKVFVAVNDIYPYEAYILCSIDGAAIWNRYDLPIQPFFPNNLYSQSIDITEGKIVYALVVQQISESNPVTIYPITVYIFDGSIPTKDNPSITWKQLYQGTPFSGQNQADRGSIRVIKQ